LGTIDLSLTPEGLHQLGLKPENVSKAESLIPLLQPHAVGRIKVVKAVRAYWAALHGPADRIGSGAKRASFELMQGLLSFPTAASVYSDFGAADRPPLELVCGIKGLKVVYRAVLRALASKDFWKPVKTSDLLSPWTGKPLACRYDGERIEVTIDRGGDEYEGAPGPSMVSVPPKPPKRERG